MNKVNTSVNVSKKVKDRDFAASGMVGTSSVDKKSGEQNSKRSGKRAYSVGVIVTLIVLGATGSVLFLRIQESGGESVGDINFIQPTPFVSEPESIVGSSPEISSEADSNKSGLRRDEISLEIMNGSDVSGLAGDTAETFEVLGYKIAEIGNAREIEGNHIYINPDLEKSVDILLEDVKKELGISTVSGILSNSDASARIVLGK